MNTSVLIFIIVVAVVVLVVLNLVNKTNVKGIDKTHFINEWNDIIAEFKDPKSRNMSVINADKLLDEALKCMGFGGETMGQRLIGAKNSLKHRDAIWNAHKLRNKIVHETRYDSNEKTVKAALQAYHQTFKDLGVL